MNLWLFARRLRRPLLASLAAAAVAGCSVKTSVVATSATAPTVTHVYVTVGALWFNPSATAKASDTSWAQVTLNTPVTIDLVDPSRALPSLVSDASLPPGTYTQLKLVLISNSATLQTSAQTLGLTNNDQVTYTAANGSAVNVPLEFASQSDALVVIPMSIVLKGSDSLSAASTATSTATSAATDTGSSSTGTTTGTTTATTSSSTTALVTIETYFDVLRHLSFFTYGTQTGALLNAQASALDSTLVGGISGTLDLSALSSALPLSEQGIIATAEQLSSDGSREVALGSATVQSDGTFLIFPLPVASSGTTSYDVVIHGAGIAPIVVVSVPVSAGLANAATSLQTTPITVSAAASYSVVMPAVSTSATGTLATCPSGYAALPAGSDVHFYQRLSSPAGSAPYLIETAGLNPLTRQFNSTLGSNAPGCGQASNASTFVPWSLANSTVSVGTYNAGAAISFATQTPVLGEGAYTLTTAAPLHAESALATTLVRAPGGSQIVTLYPAAPALISGMTSAVLPIQLQQTTAGRFNTGTLVISQAGAVVEAIDLSSAFASAGSGPLSINVKGIPIGSGGTAASTAVYDVQARVWNSASPAATLVYASLSAPLDLSLTAQPIATVITLP